jgi:3-hydroxy-3-methylglutaryl CoA synthase
LFDIIIFKMKRTILLLILFIPFFINAQDPYNYKFGGRVFENGRKLTPSDINIYFSDNPEILKLYTKGIVKKSTGNFLLYSGLLSTAYALHEVNKEGNETVIAATSGYGVLAILFSIPIKIGYQKKIKKAVLLMNKEIESQNKEVLLYDVKLISTQSGIGLKITF